MAAKAWMSASSLATVPDRCVAVPVLPLSRQHLIAASTTWRSARGMACFTGR